MAELEEMGFRSLLLSIDNDLGREDVEALKFLCRDILSSKKLQDVKSAEKIFQMLLDQDMLNKDNPFLLAELLYRIRKYSMLRRLNYTKESVQAALPMKGTISPYRQLLYDISEDIGNDQHQEIIFLLNDVLPRKHKETSSTLHLLTVLESQDLLSPDNLVTLEKIFEKVSPDLLRKIKKYKSEKSVALPCQETSPSSEVQRSLEESEQEPGLKYHPVRESMPCQKEDLNANYSTDIAYEEARTASHSLSRLSLDQTSDESTTGGTAEEFPVYKMGEKCRGHCVIINNNQFKTYRERRGTAKDVEALEKVFVWLGLQVCVYTDQQSSDIERCLQKFQSISHSNMDCFVCCILSHGESGSVHGSDEELVPIQRLTSYFTPQKCPTLAGKPKLFFIQACQGKETQAAALIEADANTPKSIPEAADFLLGMATVDGFSCFRHATDGTWYIQSLCKNLVTLVPKHEDILSILIKVNQEVSEQADPTGKKKQMPQPAYTLTKKVIFPVPCGDAPNLK